jgi:hypothetical protein
MGKLQAFFKSFRLFFVFLNVQDAPNTARAGHARAAKPSPQLANKKNRSR